MSPDLERLQQSTEGLFPGLLGIRFVAAGKERVVGELPVRRELCTLPGRVHGGALMAFADTLGAYGAVLNLPEGAGTTTLESKTNFLAAGPEGEVLTGEAIPLHLGSRTMVWQTRISCGNKLVALITQTPDGARAALGAGASRRPRPSALRPSKR